jgi:cysteine desulfurase
LGKVPVDVERDGIDLLACSAHKLYGPKGAGALYIRRKNPRVRLSPQLDGGGQERGFRSGTLNVPGIVGFGKASYLAATEMKDYLPAVSGLRDRLEKSLLTIKGARLNGHSFLRVPTVTNISFAGESGRDLAGALGKDLAISSGSACHSANPEPSHVLKAMGLNDELSYRAVRFSLGKYNTGEEVNFAVERVKQTLNMMDNEMEKLKIQQ